MMRHSIPTHGIPEPYQPAPDDPEHRSKTYALEEIFFALERMYAPKWSAPSLMESIATWYGLYATLGCRLPLKFMLDNRWENKGKYRGADVHNKADYANLF